MFLTASSLLHRLGERDRMLLERFALRSRHRRATLILWSVLTRLGGASFTIASCLIPLAWHGRVRVAAQMALTVLVASHLAVQLVKRSVVRARPVSLAGMLDITPPDCFSFPSGHAAAAMSVAFGYAAVFPDVGLILFPLAFVVGASRVALGVHYPGDVLAGQTLALLTGALVLAA